jgi:serpin B
MWTCPKCGEQIEDQFDSCWKCAAPPKETAVGNITASCAPGRWRLLYLCGILFDVFLFALGSCLPEGFWFSTEFRNFVLQIHYPVLWFSFNLFGGLALLLVPLVMAVFWAILFDLALRLRIWLLDRWNISGKQKIIIRCAFGLIGLLALVLVIMSARPQVPTHFAASSELKSTVEGNTAFALDLYQKLKDRPGNLFFSPYSISTSLAMTYAGARGQTETEMAKVLHFNLTQTNLPMAFGELDVRLNRVQRWNRIILLTANSLWCQRDYRFTDAFLNLIRKFYHAEARPVDFIHSAPAAAKEINDWVGQQTKGKIQNAVAPDQFTDLTRLVLCNAIYFKGKWQHQFKVRDTKPGEFRVATNKTVTVPMMSQKAHFKMTYGDYDAPQLLELPYTGTDLSMIILLSEDDYLPEGQTPGLPGLEPKLTADNLRSWLARLDQANPHETRVTLPRFTTTQSFELVKELQAMGMTSAFKEGIADFCGMDGTTNLLISAVLHKAFVDVNESGTEAAATTVNFVRTAGMANRFVVDHPFIFLIRDNGSGSILFLGRIVDPTK